MTHDFTMSELYELVTLCRRYIKLTSGSKGLESLRANWAFLESKLSIARLSVRQTALSMTGRERQMLMVKVDIEIEQLRLLAEACANDGALCKKAGLLGKGNNFLLLSRTLNTVVMYESFMQNLNLKLLTDGHQKVDNLKAKDEPD